MVRSLSVLLSVILLAGCAGSTPAPMPVTPAPAPVAAPIAITITLAGKGDNAVGTIAANLYGVQVLRLVEYEGRGTITFQSKAPWVTFDGLIVTPKAGREADVERRVAAGDVLIRRDGQPVGLTPRHDHPHDSAPPTN